MTDSILIIEGDPTLRRELASALSEANFTVEAVRGYIEARMILDELIPTWLLWMRYCQAEMAWRFAASYTAPLVFPLSCWAKIPVTRYGKKRWWKQELTFTLESRSATEN